MEAFHVVGGLPRSGSTLLCNILNQNPRFYVSSTSPLFQSMADLAAATAKSPEIRGMLIRDREGTLNRIQRSMRAYCDAWYGHIEKEVVIDKCRFWNYSPGFIANLWPQAKVVTIVRDLRSIFASIEKRHQETAFLDDQRGLLGKTLINRSSFMFSAEGPIGSALHGMMDLIRRKPPNWVWIKYEDLCQDPALTLRRIYRAIDAPDFAHDFSNVENVAEDVDEIYLLKFPHEGCGPVRRPDTDEWRKWVSPDIEELIGKEFALYNKTFGYRYPSEPRDHT